MVITAWALVVGAGSRPRFGGENVLMLGDNMATVHWTSKCRGGKEPRSGTLMRMLGCLEMRSGWYFRAKHVKGVANTLADGISRWERDNVNRHLHEYRPDINWQEQQQGETCVQGYWRAVHVWVSCGLVSAHLRVIFQVLDQISRGDERCSVFFGRHSPP